MFEGGKTSINSLETLFDNSFDIVNVLTSDGVIKYENKAVTGILGFNQLERKGHSIFDYIYPADLRMFKSEFKNKFKNQKTKEFKFLDKNGHWVILEVAGKDFLSDLSINGIVINCRDIGERKKLVNNQKLLEYTQIGLQASEKKLVESQEIAGMGIWELDIEKNKLSWSKGVYNIFGLKPKTVKPTYEGFLEYVYPEDREEVNSAYISALKNKQDYEIEHRIIKEDNEVRHVREKCITEFDDQGNPVNSIGIILDITAQKETETRLLEANKSKDKLFSIIAHDLRGPFGAVVGLAEFCLDEVKENNFENVEEFCSLIKYSTKKCYSLLDTLLLWSRMQTSRIYFKPKKRNLFRLTNKTISFLRGLFDQKNINVSIAIDKDLTVFADKYMLETILRNLIENSIKYTNANGGIQIAATRIEDSVEIVVQDNGVGMDKNVFGRLFKIGDYFTTKGTNKEEGTGLGLALCKEFVEKHGGSIRVESEVNKGAKFIFTIKDEVKTL